MLVMGFFLVFNSKLGNTESTYLNSASEICKHGTRTNETSSMPANANSLSISDFPLPWRVTGETEITCSDYNVFSSSSHQSAGFQKCITVFCHISQIHSLSPLQSVHL